MSEYCKQFNARQMKIAQLIYAEGLSNAEIGERLHFATSTIKNDLNKMYDISGIKGRFKLAIQLKHEGCF